MLRKGSCAILRTERCIPSARARRGGHGPMKIFITGATGVIGRRVLSLLQQAGHEVSAIARSAEQRAAFEASGVRAADVSLFDASALRRAVAGHEAVINLATH